MAVLRGVFSFLHQTGCRVKNCLYARGIKRPARPPLPVISVGNLTFGGTGKTPLSLEILSFLLNRGLKPALISRGYGGRWERTGGILTAGTGVLGDWRDAGDEPALAARKLPGIGVFLGKNRLNSCRKAREMGFQVAVLDDGFQHRRLHRDLDIVLFDPEESLFLRESLSSLRRADLVLIKNGLPAGKAAPFLGPDRVSAFKVIPDGLAGLNGKEAAASRSLKGKNVLAFCGIAGPDRFFKLLEGFGALIARRLVFPDHYDYPMNGLRKIRAAFKASGAELAVTTEKDAVKLDSGNELLAGLPLLVLRIKIETSDLLYERIQEILRKTILGT